MDNKHILFDERGLVGVQFTAQENKKNDMFVFNFVIRSLISESQSVSRRSFGINIVGDSDMVTQLRKLVKDPCEGHVNLGLLPGLVLEKFNLCFGKLCKFGTCFYLFVFCLVLLLCCLSQVFVSFSQLFVGGSFLTSQKRNHLSFKCL